MGRTSLKEKGITLVALVVTIIVLLILAGITINMAIDNNGLIQRAKDASEVYAQAEKNETKQLSEFADSIDELTGKTRLSEDKILVVNNRIKDPTKELQEVAYEAKEITDDETSVAGQGRSVTVEGAYSGKVSNQVFYQSEIGAIGSSKLKWYVLSADENGVNIVSEPTKKAVHFAVSAGYDNCLYYLNELSTKLFVNEDLGITESRVHAFRLTDIKNSAEKINAGIEWNWDKDVMNKLIKGNGATLGAHKTYTTTTFTYHPAIYSVKEETTEVETDNSMYDEEPGNKITDNSIKRNEPGNPASKLTVNNTDAWDSSEDSWKGKLGTFGNSKVAEELFKSDNYYLLASRCVEADAYEARFKMRSIDYGYLSHHSLCTSQGNVSQTGGKFRVVVSVPGSNVNIAEDGTVTLKSKNS